MIPLMRNSFFNEYETKQALAEFIIKTPRLSMDTMCYEFEKAFAAAQKRRHAILFNSGGSANLALLQALKNLGYLRQGDRIGFSALTWSTNVMPIIQLGFEPVAIDCEPRTLNVMSHNLEERLRTSELKALFITNALGFSGDLDAIRTLCKERAILLLEDACESLGTELPSGKTGNFGLAASFSMFVAHHMSTVEGGLVCTDEEELAAMLRIVRANGWDRNLTPEQQLKWRRKFNIKSEFDAKYTFYDLGFNMRPTEITGFLGLNQLKYLEQNILRRGENFKRLDDIVMLNSDLLHLDYSHISRLSSFAFPVVCKTPALRDTYLRQFSGAGVEIRPMIAGNMQRQPFFQKYVRTRYDMPGADMVHDCGFYCGNYPELTDTDLATLTSCLQMY
jgi:CDP-6-deoxy-D-xylo-4-hexulose-3-dehydrase